MTKPFRPLLAVEYSPGSQRFPVQASPKVDGIRCLALLGVATSRSMKPIPNRHVQEFFREHGSALHGLDGELVVGPENAPDVFNRSSSELMSRDGRPDFRFLVFDAAPRFSPTMLAEQFHGRLRFADERVHALGHPRVQTLSHRFLYSLADLEDYEAGMVARGFEGVMLRDPYGRYKEGRSTLREGTLLKVKQFEDAEGEVVGFEEEMQNTNEATVGELGQTKRSFAQAGMVGKGTLGVLRLRVATGPFKGVEVGVGSGLNATQRRELWLVREKLLGKLVAFKYQKHGSKDAPRLPIFKGFRSELDL